jgi:hypothetical protein
VRNRLKYLIDWEGWGPSERCWVDARKTHANEKVEEFHRRYPNKPKPVGKG